MHPFLSIRPRLLVAAALAACLSIPFAARADRAPTAAAGDISIPRATARATVPGQPAGAVYLIIENRGKNADRLVGVASPVARTAELHTMSMQGNIMKMREVGEIPVPASASVTMKPGDGYHVMLMGLKQPLKAGDQVPLTLTFEKSGKVEVRAMVEGDARAPGNAGGPAMHSGAGSHAGGHKDGHSHR